MLPIRRAVEAVRKPRNQWPALGTLLLRDGAVTELQLERALELQRAQPERRLGEILTEQGFVPPGAISRVLAEQHELAFVDLDTRPIDQTAALLLPEQLARRYRALPIEFLEDGSLLVAVADPTNVMFSDELRLAVGMPVRICVSPPESIEAAITSVNDATPVQELVTSLRDEEDDTSILDLNHNTPAVVFVNKAISSALDVGASDIHFTPQPGQLLVRIRVDGVMRELATIARAQAPAVVSRLKIMGGLDIAERRVPQDGRVSVRRGDESMDVRMATLPTTYGEKVTLRMLSQGEAPDSLDSLGMSSRSHAALERAISQPFGAVVVVGPTGSGKTTTLFTCLGLLNTPDRQLTTIEDPVEYRVEGLDQVEVNPRAGLTFANGLRTILRSDPDVLLVGEIRDEETAQIAFRAAMTGHLILTTLHAQTAAASIQRLTDMNIERSILATSINCIVGQRLARRVCLSCCVAADPDHELLRSLGLDDELPDGASFVRAVGCRDCGGTGYRGRTPLFEVMTMTDEIALLVGAATRDIEAMAVSQGMATLREDGVRLAAAGITTLEEIRRVAGETLVDQAGGVAEAPRVRSGRRATDRAPRP
jgi:type IV pilus assembly protein PilB